MDSKDQKFNTLNSIGVFIAAVGWIVLVIGVIVAIVMMSKLGVGGLLVLIGAVVAGLLVVAQGQMVQCFVAIEKNTRTSARQYQKGDENSAETSASGMTESERALERIIKDWEVRFDFTLNLEEKAYLQKLIPALRDDLTVEDWFSIARLLKKNLNANLEKFKRA